MMSFVCRNLFDGLRNSYFRSLFFVIFFVGFSILFSSCTQKPDSALYDSSSIVIQPGSLIEFSTKDFFQYSDKDYLVYFRSVDDSNKLKTTLDLTPKDDERKKGAATFRTVVPKGTAISGSYIVEVVMDNYPDFKLSSFVFDGEITVPSISTSLAWGAISSDPDKRLNSYSKEQIQSLYTWIEKYIPGQLKTFGVESETTSFPQLYKFLQNGLANNLEFINLLNSFGTHFSYDNNGKYVSGPILFGTIKYPPLLDPTLTRPFPGDNNITEKEKLNLQIFGRDLSGDMVFYSWRMQDESGNWNVVDTGSNLFSWTPDYGAAKDEPYKFQVLVSNGGPFSLWLDGNLPTWNIYVTPYIRAPSITQPNCVLNAYVRTEWSCTLHGTDPTNYPLKWKVTPDTSQFSYVYVNDVKITDLDNPPLFDGDTITIRFTPLNIDGKQFPVVTIGARLYNNPTSYEQYAKSTFLPLRITINDQATPPIFQAMARPYSNGNPKVTGYDPAKNLTSELASQNPSFVIESPLGKVFNNNYKYGPLRVWDQVCDKDPDTGLTDDKPEIEYHFQVKVKSQDDATADPTASTGLALLLPNIFSITSKSASDHVDQFQIMSVDSSGLVVNSPTQVTSITDPADANNTLDVTHGLYDPTDHTTVFYFKVSKFDTPEPNGKPYQIKICNDHSGPPPNYDPLCSTLSFGLVVEKRTPCVFIATSADSITASESNPPKLGVTGSSLGNITSPGYLAIQPAKSVSASSDQNCVNDKCSVGTDVQIQFLPNTPSTDPYDILSDLPFIQNRRSISNPPLPTYGMFYPYRLNTTDADKKYFNFFTGYPDYSVIPQTSRQEINISSYSMVPGYVALKSSNGNLQKFFFDQVDPSNGTVQTTTPLPIKNQIKAEYSVTLPNTGQSRTVRQYFTIPLYENVGTTANNLKNSLCKVPSLSTDAPLSSYPSTVLPRQTTSAQGYSFYKWVNYHFIGTNFYNTFLNFDPVLEVVAPIWPCFPAQDIYTNSSIELVKLSTDSNSYSNVSIALDQVSSLNKYGYFTYQPNEIGYLGNTSVNFNLTTSSGYLPTIIPEGTFFVVTKTTTLNSKTYTEHFLFKAAMDSVIPSNSNFYSLPVVFAWKEMKVPEDSLSWTTDTWNFTFNGQTVTSPFWSIKNKDFYPFVGWNKFDTNTKDATEKSTLKVIATSRSIIEIGEISRFKTTENNIQLLTSNTPPLTVLNSSNITGNDATVTLVNLSASTLTINPATTKLKAENGSLFEFTNSNAFSLSGNGASVNVAIRRTSNSVDYPVLAYTLTGFESTDPIILGLTQNFPLLRVNNSNQITGYSSNVTLSNISASDVQLDIDQTKLLSTSGVQFVITLSAPQKILAIPANSSITVAVSRDFTQDKPVLQASKSVTLNYRESDAGFTTLPLGNATVASTAPGVPIQEMKLITYENANYYFSLKDLYEKYSFTFDLTNSTNKIPPSCALSGGSLPVGCSLKLCQYPLSQDASCSTPCSGDKLVDSRFCYFRYTPTANDVPVNGSNYIINVKAKGLSSNTEKTITLNFGVIETNQTPIFSYVNASDPTDSSKYSSSSNWIDTTKGQVITDPFDTTNQNSYSSLLTNFIGFTENGAITLGKVNSYRIFSRSLAKSTTYSTLNAVVKEFWYYDASLNLVKEASIPSGIGFNSANTSPTTSTPMTCLKIDGGTLTSCTDSNYNSWSYIDINWKPTDAQSKKYSHNNGVIIKLEISSGTGANFKAQSIFYKFKVNNVNQGSPSFITTNGSAYTITSTDPNNFVDTADKSLIQVYVDTYVKFKVTIEDVDGSSPLGSSWNTILSLCNSEVNETDSHVCNIGSEFSSTDFPKISVFDSNYGGNRYLNDGVSLNSNCRNSDGSLKTQLAIPYISGGALVTTGVPAGSRRYTYNVEWCPQRSQLGTFSGSLFAKDFGDKDRNGNLSPSNNKSTSLKFKVVSRPFFTSPSYNLQTGIANHYMRQAFANMTNPFVYYLRVNNSLGNPLKFYVSALLSPTQTCSISASAPTCSLTNGINFSLNSLDSNSAIISWSPKSSDISSNLSSPINIRVQVNDLTTGYSDFTTFPLIVKDPTYTNYLHDGIPINTYESTPSISSVTAKIKNYQNIETTYTQTFDGTNYNYTNNGNVLNVDEGKDINFDVTYSDPNIYDALFVRWFIDGKVLDDKDIANGEATAFKYTPDSNAGGTVITYNGVALPMGYHVLRVEVSDGNLMTAREWKIKVRNTILSPTNSTSFNILTARQNSPNGFTPTKISSTTDYWSQEVLVNTSSQTDYLVLTGNYKKSSLTIYSLWSVPFINGVDPGTTGPFNFNEFTTFTGITKRLDYNISGSNVNILFTAIANRFPTVPNPTYSNDGSNSLSVTLPIDLTTSVLNPCVSPCSNDYFNSGDSGLDPNYQTNSGSGDFLSKRVFVNNVGNTKTVPLFAVYDANRQDLYLDKGNQNSRINIKTYLNVPATLTGRAITYSPQDRILYFIYSGSTQTLIKRLDVSGVVNASSSTAPIVTGSEVILRSDVVIKNGTSDFDFYPQGLVTVPVIKSGESYNYRLISYFGKNSSGGGILILDPNKIGTAGAYKIIKDTGNTLSGSISDVPGTGQRLLYDSYNQQVVGLSKDTNQYFTVDPYSEVVTVTSGISGGTPVSLLSSPSGLILTVDRSNGKIYQFK